MLSFTDNLQRVEEPSTPSSDAAPKNKGADMNVDEEIDIEALAEEVYRLMKQELLIDRQRMGPYRFW